MAAITWKQLVSPDDSGAFKALHAAGDTINTGFDAVNKAIASRQLANQTQEDIGRKANVAAYLDAVQQANTPEAAAALQADPRMQALGAAVDPRDRDLVRNAIETRLSSTRQNVTAGQTFQADQLLQQHLPTLNEASAAYARNDQVNGDRLMGTVPTSVRDYAKWISSGMKEVEARKTFIAAQLTAGEQQARDRAETLAIPQRVAADQERNRIAEGQLTVSRERERNATIAHLNEQLTKAQERLFGHEKQVVGTAAGNAAVLDEVRKAIPDKAQQETVLQYVGKALADPNNAGMSVATMVSTAIGQEDDRTWLGRYFGTKSFRGEDLGTALKTLRNQPGYGESSETQQINAGLAADQVLKLRQQLSSLMSPAGTGAAPEGAVPVVPVAPVNPPTSAPAPSAPSVAPQQALMDKRVEFERVKIALGEQKDFSPEVRQYMVEQNRQAAENGVRSMAAGGAKMGAAFNDLVTLPVRGVAGAINSVIGIPNALGASIPTIPDNGWLSSMTPYSDRLNSESSREDLIKQRNELERSIKEASKKVK